MKGRRNDQPDRNPLDDQHFRPLTCTFAPPAGLEPAPYGLEVDPRPSTPSHRVPFLLLRYGRRSRWCRPVAVRCAWKNDRRNDRRRLRTISNQLPRGLWSGSHRERSSSAQGRPAAAHPLAHPPQPPNPRDAAALRILSSRMRLHRVPFCCVRSRLVECLSGGRTVVLYPNARAGQSEVDPGAVVGIVRFREPVGWIGGGAQPVAA